MTGTYAAIASARIAATDSHVLRFAVEQPGKIAAIVLNSPSRDDPARCRLCEQMESAAL